MAQEDPGSLTIKLTRLSRQSKDYKKYMEVQFSLNYLAGMNVTDGCAIRGEI